MSGVLLGTNWQTSFVCPNRESHKCSHRLCKHKRSYYRAQYHRKNLLRERAKNRKRYHEKYKIDPAYIERALELRRSYGKKQTKEWHRARYMKYRKSYSSLSSLTRSKIREACRKWTTQNWEKRVEYARRWRARQPLAGLRKAIANAKRTGELGKLTEKCFAAIMALNE